MDEVRCRGCARQIWQRSVSPLVNGHGRPLEEASDAPVGAPPCEDWRHGQVFAEGEILPTWVESAVSESGWRVGKLMCECGAPLGSFDFVSGRRCACGFAQLPPVRLNTKKIDLFLERPSAYITSSFEHTQTLA